MDSSTNSLVTRIGAGDRAAEQTLVKTYWKPLHYVLLQRCQNATLADDIAQETFILVIEKARNGDIENPAAIGAFVRQVGVNLLIAGFRKDTRRKTDCDEAIDVSAADQSISPERQLDEQQMLALVRKTIKELPTERDRDLLFRYFVYGHSKQQTCRHLEISADHFDRVLHRARQRLKQLIEKKFGVSAMAMLRASLYSLALIFMLWSPLAPAMSVSQLKNDAFQVRGFLANRHYVLTDQHYLACSRYCEDNQVSFEAVQR